MCSFCRLLGRSPHPVPGADSDTRRCERSLRSDLDRNEPSGPPGLQIFHPQSLLCAVVQKTPGSLGRYAGWTCFVQEKSQL